MGWRLGAVIADGKDDDGRIGLQVGTVLFMQGRFATLREGIEGDAGDADTLWLLQLNLSGFRLQFA